MLEALGSMEEVNRKEYCCDVCGFDKLLTRLHFESKRPSGTVGKKRRKAAYSVSDDITQRLQLALREARDKYLADNEHFLAFGPQSICCDTLIDHICEQAKFLKQESDLDAFYALRPVLRPLFFKIIHDILSVTAVPKKSRCILR